MSPSKMKVDEIDLDAWDEQEYDPDKKGGTFEKYDGEIPPTGTMLRMRVTKMWMTYTAPKPDGGGDEPMLKVLSVAEDNDGDLAEYDGLPCWDNLGLFASMKFKTQPFLDHFGLDIRDFKGPKASMMVEDDDDNIGIPITKVKKFVPGSDGAMFVAVISKEKYKGNWQAHVDEWLDADTEIEAEEAEEKPAARRSRSTQNGGRRSKASSATGRGRRQREEPDEDEPEGEEEEERPARSGRTRRQPAGKQSARGTRTRGSKAADDEPPF